MQSGNNRSMWLLIVVILCVGFVLSAAVLACVGVETAATIMAVAACITALAGFGVLYYFSTHEPQEIEIEENPTLVDTSAYDQFEN